jgi:hypothetical protein
VIITGEAKKEYIILKEDPTSRASSAHLAWRQWQYFPSEMIPVHHTTGLQIPAGGTVYSMSQNWKRWSPLFRHVPWNDPSSHCHSTVQAINWLRNKLPKQIPHPMIHH